MWEVGQRINQVKKYFKAEIRVKRFCSHFCVDFLNIWSIKEVLQIPKIASPLSSFKKKD